MANKPEIKKERTHSGRGKEKNKTTLSEKKEEARNVSEQRDKGWIQVICVHDTIQSIQQHSRATDAHELPHTKKE